MEFHFSVQLTGDMFLKLPTGHSTAGSYIIFHSLDYFEAAQFCYITSDMTEKGIKSEHKTFKAA